MRLGDLRHGAKLTGMFGHPAIAPNAPTPARAGLAGASAWLGRGLLLAAALCVLAAGGLLWWRHGGDVFGAYLLTAMAWCF
jgi:hypothetical protein